MLSTVESYRSGAIAQPACRRCLLDSQKKKLTENAAAKSGVEPIVPLYVAGK